MRSKSSWSNAVLPARKEALSLGRRDTGKTTKLRQCQIALAKCGIEASEIIYGITKAIARN